MLGCGGGDILHRDSGLAIHYALCSLERITSRYLVLIELPSAASSCFSTRHFSVLSLIIISFFPFVVFIIIIINLSRGSIDCAAMNGKT